MPSMPPGIRRSRAWSGMPDFLARFHQAYLDEMIDWIACIRGGRAPEATGRDARAALAIALAARESPRTGGTAVRAAPPAEAGCGRRSFMRKRPTADRDSRFFHPASAGGSVNHGQERLANGPCSSTVAGTGTVPNRPGGRAGP